MSFSLILLGVTGVMGGNDLKGRGILGGPAGVITRVSAGELSLPTSYHQEPVLTSQPTVDNMGNERFRPYFAGLYDENNILSASLEGSSDMKSDGDLVNSVMVYKVKRGDTLSQIAKSFGISQNTLKDANPSLKGKPLKAGQEINILTVSGVVHELIEGETPESVASSYNISLADLQTANKGINFNRAEAGVSLIIPGKQSPIIRSEVLGRGGLPDLGGYFIMPTEGFNWGKLHARNAVDIANACGTPVVASAEGLVVPGELCDGSMGWNGGYGECITLEHPNGTKTRYAHLSKTSVSVGDYVKQGEVIGAMGDSGEATGCHVHFEVEGAKNPFAK